MRFFGPAGTRVVELDADEFVIATRDYLQLHRRLIELNKEKLERRVREMSLKRAYILCLAGMLVIGFGAGLAYERWEEYQL